MIKSYRLSILLLLTVLTLWGCAAAPETASADVSTETAVSTEAAVTGSVPKFWEPTLEVERFSATGAVIVFQMTEDLGDHLVLAGNDYTLEVLTEKGWEPLPTTQEQVNWVQDAFVVTAVPRDDIDWQWLYGTLAPGHYRICKPVSLLQHDQILQRSTVYGEFTLQEVQESSDAASQQIPDISAISYVPLETLGSSYTPEQAAMDQVVILENGSATQNQAVWYAFVEATADRQVASVRCMHIGKAGTIPALYDLSFDGLMYNMRWFDAGVEKSVSFKHLVRMYGGADGDTYPLIRYVLAMDGNVTWDDIQWGMASPSENDDIAHRIVYQELGYDLSQIPIPENVSATLSLGGRATYTATDAQSARAAQILDNAQLLDYTPDMEYHGNDLILRSSDGRRVTLWLDSRDNLLLCNGYYYRYDKAAVLQIFGIQQLP